MNRFALPLLLLVTLLLAGCSGFRLDGEVVERSAATASAQAQLSDNVTPSAPTTSTAPTTGATTPRSTNDAETDVTGDIGMNMTIVTTATVLRVEETPELGQVATVFIEPPLSYGGPHYDSLSIGSETIFAYEDGRPAALMDLQPGTALRVTGRSSGGDGLVYADEVVVLREALPTPDLSQFTGPFGGVVETVEVATGTIRVRGGGALTTVIVGPEVPIQLGDGGAAMELSDLQPDTALNIFGSLINVSTVRAERITVTAMSETQALADSTPTSNAAPYNGDFEYGPHGWQGGQNIDTSQALEVRSGNWAARLGTHTLWEDFIAQELTVPEERPYLVFWYRIQSECTEPRDDEPASNYVEVQFEGEPVLVLALCVPTEGWERQFVHLPPATRAELRFTAMLRESSESAINFFLDDLSFVSIEEALEP